MSRQIFLLGVPLDAGGANVERGDTAMLWASRGIKVSVLYFTRCKCRNNFPQPDESTYWRTMMDEANVPYLACESGKLHQIPGLRGGIVVVFCNPHVRCIYPELRHMGCKVIHVPCMTDIQTYEASAFGVDPPDVVVYQSHFQKSQLSPTFQRWGVKKEQIIRGAFNRHRMEFAIRPHSGRPEEPFVVGRLARAHRTKWNPKLWDIFHNVRSHGIQAIPQCQGWTFDLAVHCGNPPEWAGVGPENTLSTKEFLSYCHCLICPNWLAVENWPRVGLEAFASGVPVIADNKGGWVEMIQNMNNGILVNNVVEYGKAIETLAHNPQQREAMAMRAGATLNDLCNPGAIGGAWDRLFSELGG